jgi:hypothetical protein
VGAFCYSPGTKNETPGLHRRQGRRAEDAKLAARASPSQHSDQISKLLSDLASRLAAMHRYERDALSRRKFVVRDFDAAFVSRITELQNELENHQQNQQASASQRNAQAKPKGAEKPEAARNSKTNPKITNKNKKRTHHVTCG